MRGISSVRELEGLPRPMVMTNGVFDILHRGHADYLEAARAMGASLVVAINSDHSARSLGKGAGRPINSEKDRAALVAALRCVDAVILFDVSPPIALLDELRPEIYVKGGDYCMDGLPEARFAKSWGCKTASIPIKYDTSTTQIVERIRNGAK